MSRRLRVWERVLGNRKVSYELDPVAGIHIGVTLPSHTRAFSGDRLVAWVGEVGSPSVPAREHERGRR